MPLRICNLVVWAGLMVPGPLAFGQAAAPQQSPAAAPAAAPAGENAAAGLRWPRTFETGPGKIVVYQPQVESWEENRLQARAAVSVIPAGSTEPEYGVVTITARTEVDKENRMVTLADLKLTDAKFPDAKPEEQQKFLEALRRQVPEGTRDVPLDHLEANLAMTQAQAKSHTVAVKNNPPKVIFSKTPALQQVPGQTLMRVINTRALIVLEQVTNQYYLHAMNRWYQAPAATGPWAVAAGAPPAGIDQLMLQLGKSKTVDLLDPNDPAAAPKEPPTIYVSTTPAELIQTDGDPEYTPIPGTKLLYAKNTDSALFM